MRVGSISTMSMMKKFVIKKINIKMKGDNSKIVDSFY